MGYLADFVTGRSINRTDRIVALIIVPVEKSNDIAKATVYAGDMFLPLSLPMHGQLDEYGFFKPDEGDLGLEILLSAVHASNWQDFADKGVNALHEPWTFPSPDVFNRDAIASIMPGIAAMHASTFTALVKAGTPRNSAGDEHIRAAAIVHDAKKRWAEKDDFSYNTARMQPPGDRLYTTTDGLQIEVPHLCMVLSELDGDHRVSRYLDKAIRDRHKNDHLTDGTALVRTYALLQDFQRAAYGLHRYWAPSRYARGENLDNVALLQIQDLKASLNDVSERLCIEIPEDRGFDKLIAIADGLREALDRVETEIANIRSSEFAP